MHGASSGRTRKPSLTRQDWIDAAADVMVVSSVDQIRLDKLASSLNASKGSFYWHFQDRQALLAAVLETWKDRATLAIHARLDNAESSPARRLLLFMQLPLRSESSLRAADLELAILGWARSSHAARATLELVDQLRTDKLSSMFIELGLPQPEALFRAQKAYAFIRYVSQRRDIAIVERAEMIAKVHAELVADVTTADTEIRVIK